MIFTDASIQIIISLATTHKLLAFFNSTKSVGDPQIIKFKLTDECMSAFYISFCVDVFYTDEPERTDEICNQEHNDDQSSDSEGEHDELLSLGSIGSLRVLVIVFDQSFNSRNIKECNQFGKSEKSD